MRWLQEVFPNSCFIGVVRNGFAVAEGIKRKGEKPVEWIASGIPFIKKKPPTGAAAQPVQLIGPGGGIGTPGTTS